MILICCSDYLAPNPRRWQLTSQYLPIHVSHALSILNSVVLIQPSGLNAITRTSQLGTVAFCPGHTSSRSRSVGDLDHLMPKIVLTGARFADDTRERIVMILFRLTLDAALTKDNIVCSELERTITATLEEIPGGEANQMVFPVFNSRRGDQALTKSIGTSDLYHFIQNHQRTRPPKPSSQTHPTHL